MKDANGGGLERRRGSAMARTSQDLAVEIRALISRIKIHVDQLNEGRGEDDPEAIKLGRQERNYKAVASSLANAIEDAEKRTTTPLEEPATKRAKGDEGPEAKQPSAVLRRSDAPKRHRTASEVCDAEYGIPERSDEDVEKWQQDADGKQGSWGAEQMFARNIAKKHEAPTSREEELLINDRPSAHHAQSDLVPAAISAAIEPQEGILEPRIRMPAFVINPNRNAKEAGGPWRHFKEKDFGASCRRVFGNPPRKGDRTIEPVILRKHEWLVFGIADLPAMPGCADEGVNESESAVEILSEGPVDTPVEDDLEFRQDVVQEIENTHGGELEDYVSEASTPAKTNKQFWEIKEAKDCENAHARTMGAKHRGKTMSSSKKPAFNWKAFHVKTDSPSSSPISAPVPVLFTRDVGVPREHDSKQHSVKPADMEDDAIKEADLKRQDTPMSRSAVEELPHLASGPEKTFSMDQTLPSRGTNTRGRFFNPDHPRRDDLDGTTLDTFYSGRVPKRRRSPTPDHHDEDRVFDQVHQKLGDVLMQTTEDEQPHSTHGTNQRGHSFEPKDPRGDDMRRTSRKRFHDIEASNKRPRSSSSGSIHSKQKAVCKNCWQRDEFCTSKGECKKCKQGGRDCVYAHCRYGLGCRKPRCAYLHPGQFEEADDDGEWSVVTGDLGRKNSLR